MQLAAHNDELKQITGEKQTATIKELVKCNFFKISLFNVEH